MFLTITMATSKKQEDKYIETTIKGMDSKNKVVFFRTVFSVLVFTMTICVAAINLFGCRAQAPFTPPAAETDYISLLSGCEYQPVTSGLKDLVSVTFFEAENSSLAVRFNYGSSAEEGIFVLTDKATGTISLNGVSYIVHISNDAIRIIDSSDQFVDLVKIK